jgi:hypothetical protein
VSLSGTVLTMISLLPYPAFFWKNVVTKPTMSGVAWRGAAQVRPPVSLI